MAEAITKTEAVRRSIAAGVALPKLGSEWIAKNLGLDVSAAMFSTVKNKLRNEGTEPKSPTTRATGDVVELVTTLKRLIQEHGADSVIKMAEALSD